MSPRDVHRSSLRVDAVRNRDRLLTAARRALAAGDLEFRLNTLARDAGVGVATAYRHFPDRQSLVEELAVESFARLVATAREATDEPDPALGLRRLLGGGLRWIMEDPALAETLRATQPVCPEAVGLSRDLSSAIGELLRAARAAGLIRAEIVPDDLRRLLLGTAAAATWGPDEDAARERYLQVLLDGLAGPARRG